MRMILVNKALVKERSYRSAESEYAVNNMVVSFRAAAPPSGHTSTPYTCSVVRVGFGFIQGRESHCEQDSHGMPAGHRGNAPRVSGKKKPALRHARIFAALKSPWTSPSPSTKNQ